MSEACINPNVSLAELYQMKGTLRGKITVAQISGKVDDIPAMRKTLKDLTDKIKAIENVGFNGGGIIRIM